MKLALPLAVDIADCINAASAGEEFDIETKAHELVGRHPEAEATIGEVRETLWEELPAHRPQDAM